MYANDSRDYLPDNTGAYQPWDMKQADGTYFQNAGAPYKVCGMTPATGNWGRRMRSPIGTTPPSKARPTPCESPVTRKLF